MKNKFLFSFLAITLVIGLAFTAKATITSSLSYGSSGSQVTELQQALKNLGYFFGSATGYFGNLTRQAVISFQKANNINPIGVFGPASREKLNQLSAIQKNKNNKQKPKDNKQPANNQLDSVSVYESSTPIDQLLTKNAGSGLLGKITNNSVAINIIAPYGMEAFVDYGTSSGALSQKSNTATSTNGKSIEIDLSNLSANTKYYYKINYKLQGQANFTTKSQASFVTQKPAGSTYTFVIQSDPHLDGHSDPDFYKSTLQSEAGNSPDFVIDLGDDFMTEKFSTSQEQTERRYLELRSYYDIVGSSAPLFLANGNHEGEFGWLFNSSNKDNNAYWALNSRETYYPNPKNYYSWTWGDALFVVLDPYTYSTEFRKQTGDMWDSTIGDEQYKWFKQTLETSTAKYKFVFLHHMLGEFRGMTSWADKFEWGGYSNNGVYEFATKRPTWELPIHQLMVKNNVTALFQGHDHLYCKEEKDGIVYQEVPQPSTLKGDAAPGTEGQYKGQVIDSSGYLRVKVSPQNVNVEYVRTGPAESAGVASTYQIISK